CCGSSGRTRLLRGVARGRMESPSSSSAAASALLDVRGMAYALEPPAMARDNRFHAELERSAALRYALAPLCVVVAPMLPVARSGRVPAWSSFPPPIHPSALFELCVVAAAWFGGVGPGLVAALLATLTMPLLIAMNYPLVAGFFDLPRFVGFGI